MEPMRKRTVALFVAFGSVWLFGSTQREKRVVVEERAASLASLEEEAAAHPGEVERVRALVRGYLDVAAPGMALATVESAPIAVRRDAVLQHLYARALIDQGRAGDARIAEQKVLDTCASEGCSSYLLAAATHRAAVLDELATLGVEDANAQPEASRVAYHNATRQVRLEGL
jgi:hypothetical protein